MNNPQPGRFTQPDIIVPEPGDPQALNRYAYVLNNPVRYRDPSGHAQVCADGDEGGGCGYGGAWYRLAQQWYSIHDQGLLDATLLAWLQDHQDIHAIQAMAGYLETHYGQSGAILPQSFNTIYAHAFAGGELPQLVTNAKAQVLAGAIFAGVGIGGANLGGLKQEIAGGSRALVAYYPPNDGFAGEPVRVTLEPGTKIDRFGSPSGRYASPQGTPAWARALPPGADQKPLNAYEVVKPLQVDAGPTAGWFGQPGGGTQYYLGRSVEKLIELGYLRPLQ